MILYPILFWSEFLNKLRCETQSTHMIHEIVARVLISIIGSENYSIDSGIWKSFRMSHNRILNGFECIFSATRPGVIISHPFLGKAVLILEQVRHTLTYCWDICQIRLPEFIWIDGMEQVLPSFPVHVKTWIERKVLILHYPVHRL